MVADPLKTDLELSFSLLRAQGGNVFIATWWLQLDTLAHVQWKQAAFPQHAWVSLKGSSGVRQMISPIVAVQEALQQPFEQFLQIAR